MEYQWNTNHYHVPKSWGHKIRQSDLTTTLKFISIRSLQAWWIKPHTFPPHYKSSDRARCLLHYSLYTELQGLPVPLSQTNKVCSHHFGVKQAIHFPMMIQFSFLAPSLCTADHLFVECVCTHMCMCHTCVCTCVFPHPNNLFFMCWFYLMLCCCLKFPCLLIFLTGRENGPTQDP